jgi:dynein intermediate chain 2
VESLSLTMANPARTGTAPPRLTPVSVGSDNIEPDRPALGAGSCIFGGMSIDLDQTSTRFLVGTDQGSVLWCNRKGKSHNDRVTQVYHGHHGPVYAVQRNPFFNRYFLTIGDWSAKVNC